MTESQQTIGFIGGGNMAHAIIGGLLNADHRGDCLYVSDPDANSLSRISALHADITTGTDNVTTVENADILVLAVKPQLLETVMRPLAGAARPANQLAISIVAGITLNTLCDLLTPMRAIIRIMPNQPALVGAGMSVLAATPETTPQQRELAGYVAGATGEAAWIEDERLMDAVTAVSGSGPAYFYMLMELMESAARDMGLPADLARVLTRQTAYGAGRVAAESQLELAALRESVTSKGGTTAAALASFDDDGIRAIVERALRAARDRSVELGAIAGEARNKSD